MSFQVWIGYMLACWIISLSPDADRSDGHGGLYGAGCEGIATVALTSTAKISESEFCGDVYWRSFTIEPRASDPIILNTVGLTFGFDFLK